MIMAVIIVDLTYLFTMEENLELIIFLPFPSLSSYGGGGEGRGEGVKRKEARCNTHTHTHIFNLLNGLVISS